MKHTIALIPILSIILIFSGCTETIEGEKTTLPAINTNISVGAVNTNAPVLNTNSTSTTDTSGWETYASNTLGIGFIYMKAWGEIKIKTHEADVYQTGSATYLSFDKDYLVNTEKIIHTPQFIIQSADYNFFGPTDSPPIDFDALDLHLSDEELATAMLRLGSSAVIERLEVDGKMGIKMIEYATDFDQQPITLLYYFFPNFNAAGDNLAISADIDMEETIRAKLLSSLYFL